MFHTMPFVLRVCQGCLSITGPQSFGLRNLEDPQAASGGVTPASGGLSLQTSVTTQTYRQDTPMQIPAHTHPYTTPMCTHCQITLSWEMGTMPPQAGDYRFN